MRRLISSVMFLVMLLFAASPLLACMVPEPQMTADEQACCAQMAGDCGDMADSAMDHSCCKKTTVVVQTIAANNANDKVSHRLKISPDILQPASLAIPQPVSGHAPQWHLRINSPPPPLVSVTVLRI